MSRSTVQAPQHRGKHFSDIRSVVQVVPTAMWPRDSGTRSCAWTAGRPNGECCHQLSSLSGTVPPSLYAELTLSLRVGALFAEREILRLDPSHNELR